MYLDYYTGKHQLGSGNMPIFIGAKYQHGHGLGNIFSGLFSSTLLPFIKKMHQVGPVKRLKPA